MSVAGPMAPQAAELTDPFQLAGTTLDQKFRVEKLVAEGGFGVVYVGTHLALERAIAIKVLKTPVEFNEQARALFIEKFALEARTIARIRHPNIVQVLDFGVSQMPSGEFAPWMVLEWLTGQTLDDWLAARRGQRGTQPIDALTLLRPVFEAVAYAHDEGIAHRDLKPANIMLVPSRRGPVPRLLDFGIAKVMEEGESAGSGQTRTRSTQNAFSPLFAAPEQVGSSRSGPWTDVHALALILVEVLTDMSAYRAEDGMSLFGEILSPTRPSPASKGVDVGAWEPVIAKALALRAEERFPNAASFLAALEADVPARMSFPGGAKAIAMTQVDGSRLDSAHLVVPPGGAPSAATTTTAAELAVPTSRSKLPLVLGAILLLAVAGGAVYFVTQRAPSTDPTGATQAPPARPTAAPVAPSAPVAVAPGAVAPVAVAPVAITPVAVAPVAITPVAVEAAPAAVGSLPTAIAPVAALAQTPRPREHHRIRTNVSAPGTTGTRTNTPPPTGQRRHVEIE